MRRFANAAVANSRILTLAVNPQTAAASTAATADAQQLSSKEALARDMKASMPNRAPRAIPRDEEELAKVLTSQPKMVAGRIRQMMQTKQRRIAHFRHAVTFLMITLQGRLAKKQISPEDASIVLDGVLKECATLKQGEIGQLLFRAGLRFQKYGVKIPLSSVRSLFDSYKRSQATVELQQLAHDLKASMGALDDATRPIAIAAFLFAGDLTEAEALRQSVTKMTPDDYAALLEGYAACRAWEQFDDLVKEAIQKSGDDFNASLPMSTAIIVAHLPTSHSSSHGGPTNSNNEKVEQIFRQCLDHGITLNESALQRVLSLRLQDLEDSASIKAAEEHFAEQIGVEKLSPGPTTAIIEAQCRVIRHTNAKADDSMLVKISHLRDLIEVQIENGEEINLRYVLSAMRGFGALNKTDDLTKLYELAKKHVSDFLIFDEMMQQYSLNGNVRGCLSVKEDMESGDIYHSSRTYGFLISCLGRYYPKLTTRYYNEARSALKRFHPGFFVAAIRAFYDIGDKAKLKSVFEDMQNDAVNRGAQIYDHRTMSILLVAFKGDLTTFDSLLQECSKRQLLEHPAVQKRIVAGYGHQERWQELDRFLNNTVTVKRHLYLSLLRVYMWKPEQFNKTVRDMVRDDVPFTEEIYSTILTFHSRHGNKEGIAEVLEKSKQNVSAFGSSKFYSTLAETHAKLGDMQAVETTWHDLQKSGVRITMESFNRFLEIFVASNSVHMTQEVLKQMMASIPPNPVTSTTVVDMLGKMGRLDEMEVLIEEMAKTRSCQPTLNTYNIAMMAFARNGDVTKMEMIRNRMRQQNVREDAMTFNLLLEGYGRAQQYEQLPELMTERASKNIPLDDKGFETLLTLYGKARMATEVESIVSAIMDRRAEPVGTRRTASEASLTPRMLVSIAQSYSFLGDAAKVEQYVRMILSHSECCKGNIESLFLIYQRLKNTKKISELLKEHGGSEFTLNIAICAFAREGDYERVAEILKKMSAQGARLGSSSAMNLSNVLLKAGKTELAQVVLDWKGQVSEGVLNKDNTVRA